MQYYYEMLHIKCKKIKKLSQMDSFYCLRVEIISQPR